MSILLFGWQTAILHKSKEVVHCDFTYFKDEYMAHKGDTTNPYVLLTLS